MEVFELEWGGGMSGPNHKMLDDGLYQNAEWGQIHRSTSGQVKPIIMMYHNT